MVLWPHIWNNIHFKFLFKKMIAFEVIIFFFLKFSQELKEMKIGKRNWKFRRVNSYVKKEGIHFASDFTWHGGGVVAPSVAIEGKAPTPTTKRGNATTLLSPIFYSILFLIKIFVFNFLVFYDATPCHPCKSKGKFN